MIAVKLSMDDLISGIGVHKRYLTMMSQIAGPPTNRMRADLQPQEYLLEQWFSTSGSQLKSSLLNHFQWVILNFFVISLLCGHT